MKGLVTILCFANTRAPRVGLCGGYVFLKNAKVNLKKGTEDLSDSLMILSTFCLENRFRKRERIPISAHALFIFLLVTNSVYAQVNDS